MKSCTLLHLLVCICICLIHPPLVRLPPNFVLHFLPFPFFYSQPKKGKKAAVPKKVVSLDGCTGCSPFDARNGGGDDTSDALFMFRLVMGGASKSKVVVCSTDSAAAATAWIHSIKAVVFQAGASRSTVSPQYQPVSAAALKAASSEGERSMNTLYSSSWQRFDNLTMLNGRLALNLGIAGPV